MDEEYGKYKCTEMNLSQKKRVIEKQIPDIIASLDMVKVLKTKKAKNEDTDMHIMISNDLYVKTVIPPTEKVILCLGANAMIEYDLQEAEDLLNENLKTAKEAVKKLEKDLEFLQKQLTTIEVNMARVYNWKVKDQET